MPLLPRAGLNAGLPFTETGTTHSGRPIGIDETGKRGPHHLRPGDGCTVCLSVFLAGSPDGVFGD
jgi:hypothetical protein